MNRSWATACCFLGAMTVSHMALAVSSAELYTATSYPYGRFEARARLAAGDGVVSSFFLWKDGSERAGTFWNELDFEKLGAECRLETNPIYGNPSANHSKRHALALDLCGSFHSYVFDWTPEALVWSIDAVEIRRETGAAAQAFTDHALPLGMQMHLNLWPGNATFGGNFSPGILPVHQYVDWVEYSTYENGAFKLAWREDFDGAALPEGWLTGSWSSPKNLSTHAPENVNFIDGYAVLSLTADNALGPAGAMPAQSIASGGASMGMPGTSGSSSTGSTNSSGSGGTSVAGPPNAGAGSSPAMSDGGCNLGHAPPGRDRLFGALGLVALVWLQRRRAQIV